MWIDVENRTGQPGDAHEKTRQAAPGHHFKVMKPIGENQALAKATSLSNAGASAMASSLSIFRFNPMDKRRSLFMKRE